MVGALLLDLDRGFPRITQDSLNDPCKWSYSLAASASWYPQSQDACTLKKIAPRRRVYSVIEAQVRIRISTVFIFLQTLMMLLNTLALSLATLAHIVYAGPPLHRVEEPDYIIVGGGIAGFVLANRLTENPNIQVHLLEAGPDPAGDPDVSTPAFAGLLDTTKYTYNLTTTPQASLNGTTVHTVQGHGLGGGSSVNYMQYCRGAASVYDEWASITDDDGWAWDNLLPYFERSTSLVPPTESFHPVANTSMYGQGPLSLTFGKDVDVLAPEFIKVMEQSGLPQHDLNDGNGIYTSYVTQYVLSSNATRESSLTTYGYPALLRPNLQLTKNAWVTKINFLGTRAISVTYTDTIDNSTHTLFPKVDGEIIISGGAINSPKLLMLSGIGPREHLESLNIPVIADLPVGSTMQNHYGTAMTLNVSSEQWSATQLTNQTYLDIALANYTQNASGQLAQAVTSVTAAGRAPNNLSEWHASLPADRAHWLYVPVEKSLPLPARIAPLIFHPFEHITPN